MRASRFMILLYVCMVGIPVLLLIYAFSYLFSQLFIERIVLAIIAFGLILYGILSFVDVYARKKGVNPHEVQIKLRLLERKKAEEAPVPGKEGEKAVNLKIKRFNPDKKGLEESSYKMFADSLTTVLDMLLVVKASKDSTLAMRYSCRMGICGSCGMVVNGKPVLACETNVFKNLENDEISVEPMQGHALLRDLVTDFDDFFEKHSSIKPGLYRVDEKEKYEPTKPYYQSKAELDKFLPYSYCIMCGLCVDACPVSNTNKDFLGPQALSQVYRYNADSRDQKGTRRIFDVDTLDGVWGCEFAGACSEVCPKGVDPATAIQLLKAELSKNLLKEDVT